jgi:hypothetical protein
VSRRRNEIEATMNSIIDDVAAIQSALVAQESLELIVDVLNDRLETVGVVDGVTVSGSIDDRQSKLNTPLFDLDGGSVQFNRLGRFFWNIVFN